MDRFADAMRSCGSKKYVPIYTSPRFRRLKDLVTVGGDLRDLAPKSLHLRLWRVLPRVLCPRVAERHVHYQSDTTCDELCLVQASLVRGSFDLQSQIGPGREPSMVEGVFAKGPIVTLPRGCSQYQPARALFIDLSCLFNKTLRTGAVISQRT